MAKTLYYYVSHTTHKGDKTPYKKVTGTQLREYLKLLQEQTYTQLSVIKTPEHDANKK